MPDPTSQIASAKPALRHDRGGFTLVEIMVAGAILVIAVAGFYSVFLRVNDFAANSRCSSSAKIILEQACNLALTTGWTKDLELRGRRPTVLHDTTGQGPAGDGWVPYDLDGASDQPANGATGQVLLFIDPNNTGAAAINVTGTLYRRVTLVKSAARDPNSNHLVQTAFRVDYHFHRRAADPAVSLYGYTLRARDD